MNDTINFMNMEGLKFSGRVNASISHELKNILAIISETAGLLNDLTDLAKQGKDLELSLFENCSDSIIEEIQRGFTTIKQMNKFAHSVDVPIKKIDLLETLNLTVELSSLLSFASNVQINDSDNEVILVLTSPFLFQNLTYQILYFLYESVGPNGDIHIYLNSNEKNGIDCTFSSSAKSTFAAFPTNKIQKTADVLGIELNMQPSLLKLNIFIPYASNKINLLAKELKVDL